MGRVLGVVLGLVLLGVPMTAGPNLGDLRSSVRMVSSEDGSWHCTATAVRVKQWVTMAHCLPEMKPAPWFADEQARVIKVDEKADLLLLDGGPVVLPIPVAKDEPELGEVVNLLGFPGLWQEPLPPLIFWGHVQVLDVPIKGDGLGDHSGNRFHEGGGAGMSGGAIVNAKGELVGLMEGGTEFPSVSVASPRVKDIRKFLGMK